MQTLYQVIVEDGNPYQPASHVLLVANMKMKA